MQQSSIVKIGFTGTREGMTDMQLFHLEKLLREMRGPIEAHHGDCVGADKEFHEICRNLNVYKVVVHPPKDNKLRAYCAGDVVMPVHTYSVRNFNIVMASELVIGAPFLTYYQRGGTWQTIGLARSNGRQNIVLYPDGRIHAS